MSALEHTVDIVPIPALRVYPNIDIESVDSFTERDFEDI